MLDCEPLRDTLVELLVHKLKDYDGICSGYVVMPDHVQVIVWFGKALHAWRTVLGANGVDILSPSCAPHTDTCPNNILLIKEILADKCRCHP